MNKYPTIWTQCAVTVRLIVPFLFALLITCLAVWFLSGLNGVIVALGAGACFWGWLEPGNYQQTSAGSDRSGNPSPPRAARTVLDFIPAKIRKPFLWLVAILVTLALLPAFQVAYVGLFNPSSSVPAMIHSEEEPKMEWRDLRNVSLDFLLCAWVTEDAAFFKHGGFDWKQIQAARDEARRTGKPARGASTITQQCARSLFLWHGRSWIRKGLEAYYTIWMEVLLSKERILELYINVIELGGGVYGIEAASQHYYGVPSMELTREQSAMLVAIMPNPKEWNPLEPTEHVQRRHAVILKRTENAIFPVNLAEKK